MAALQYNLMGGKEEGPREKRDAPAGEQKCGWSKDGIGGAERAMKSVSQKKRHRKEVQKGPVKRERPASKAKSLERTRALGREGGLADSISIFKLGRGKKSMEKGEAGHLKP